MVRNVFYLLIAAVALTGVLASFFPEACPQAVAEPASEFRDWLNELVWDFTPDSDGELGHVIDGRFEEPSYLPVWTVTSAYELEGAAERIHLYAQIEYPKARPLTPLMARVRSHRSDGQPISPGVLIPLEVISSTGTSCILRSRRPLLLINNPSFEGEHRDLVAVVGAEGGSATVTLLR